MELPLVEMGLFIILMAVLIGPFIAKKVEENFEAFLLLMSLCAIAISKSWRLGFVEEVLREPLLVGLILIILLIGAILRYHGPHFSGRNASFYDRITLKVIFFEIVVVLGLSASIIAPIIPLFVLAEVANLLSLERRSKAAIILLTCISIFMGAALTLTGEPLSSVAAIKMQDSASSLLILEMLSPYLMLWILMLGLISIPFAGENMVNREISSSRGAISLKNAAILGTRACLFMGALMVAGIAFGSNL